MTTSASEVGLHFLDYWRVIRIRYGIILLTFLLVVITAGVATWFMPREYESSVFMQVRSRLDEKLIFERDEGTRREIDPIFANTQFEIIQRKEILYPVIESLALQDRWSIEGRKLSKEETYFKLRKKLGVRTVRNTDLIEITVLSQSPSEAAEIANRVAEEYQERRRSFFLKNVGSALGQLEAEVQKQRDKVASLSQELEDSREKLGIIDISQDTGQDPVEPIDNLVVQKEQEVSLARSEVSTRQSLLKSIKELTPDQLMRALRTLEIPDEVVGKNLSLYQEAVAEEARLLQSGLGEKHPRVQEVRAQATVYRQQLEEQIDSIRKSVETRLQIDTESLAAREAQLEELRKQQLQSRSRRSEYLQNKKRYDESQQILQTMEVRLSTQMMDSNMPLFAATIWERAEPASLPARPKVLLNMALGILVGLIVGVGLAFFIEYLDTSVKTMDDVERHLGVPVLAVIPKNVGLLVEEAGESRDAEAYRILRTNVEFNRKSAEANAITVVSGGAGEGKSTTVANLAFVCAQGGYTVLLVDADLRRPVQHQLFSVPNEIGLTNYLTTNLALEDVVVRTAMDNLYLLPSGVLPSDAVGILNSQRMSDMIADVKSRFDIVFFDSPPILGVSDASVLASEVDQVILVVQHRRFPRGMLQRVKQAVESVGGSVLGVVLNNVDVRHDQNYSYYTNYYHYYDYRRTDERERGRERGRRRADTAAIEEAQTGPERGGEDDY